MFLLAMISTEVTKDLFKARKFLFYRIIPFALLRHLFANLATMLCLNYLGTIFSALTFENGIKFMHANYYCVPIVLLFTLSYTRGTNLVKRVQKWEEKQKGLEGKKKN